MVKRRPDGKPFDHITELRNAVGGLKQDLANAQKAISSGKLSPTETKKMQEAVTKGQKLLNEAKAVLRQVAMYRNKNMSIKWEDKFQTSDFTASDCHKLADEIVEAKDDEDRLLSLIYMFGYSCDEDRRVVSICENYIRNPVPGLTAICLKVMCDYWNHADKLVMEIANYLDLDLFESWYDEVIFSESFVRKSSKNEFPSWVMEKYKCLRKDARFQQYIEL